MNVPFSPSWMGFVVALTALDPLGQTTQADPVPTLEGRLTHLRQALHHRAQQLPPTHFPVERPEEVGGFANGGGRQGFTKARRGGWGDGGGGSFGNVNPWRNGWADGGGFLNRRWPNGGGFLNRW